MRFDRQAVAGAVLGGLVTAGTMVAASAVWDARNDAGRTPGAASSGERASSGSAAPASGPDAPAPAVPGVLAGSASLLTDGQAAAVGCEPHEAAVVQPVSLGGTPVLATRCVVVSERPSMVEPGPAMTTGALTGVPPVQPVYASQYAPVQAPAAAPRVVREVRTVERPARSGRSWQKSALIIGGSAATGAGVGGLIGGKKGALIGTAIGGGGSAIYEATRHR